MPDKHIANRGISGTTSGEILGYLSPTWLEDKPDQVFVCLGTNDLVRDTDDETIIRNLSGIIEKIKALSHKGVPRFYLISLFPTRENSPRPNERINRLNTQIHLLAEKQQHAYLHLNVFFRDEKNRLEKSFTHDGLHLNQKGYALWAKLIERLV